MKAKENHQLETIEPFRTFTVLLQLNFALFIQLELTFFSITRNYGPSGLRCSLRLRGDIIDKLEEFSTRFSYFPKFHTFSVSFKIHHLIAQL